MYTFENTCKEDNSVTMGDEATKIFLNSDSDMDDVGEGLRAFLDYVNGVHVTDDEFIDRLEEEVKKAKANGDWRDDYMTMEMLEREKFEEGMEKGLEKGMEKGMEKGLETGIRGMVSVLRKMNIPTPKILANIQEEYGLSLEAAKKYV